MDKIIKMKTLNHIALTCLFSILLGLVFLPSVVFAQAKNNRISIPPEAILPLGTLSTEKPPLFDVVSEPGQSAQQNTTHSVDFSIVVNILLILIIVIIARKAAMYFITKKLKEEMNTSTKK